MSKDEIAARREARKRRILANSEKRLTKIISCDKSNIADSDVLHPLVTEWNNHNGIITTEPKLLEVPETVVQPDPVQQLYLLDEVDIKKETLPSQTANHKEHVFTKEKISDAKPDEDKMRILLWIDCLFVICLSFLVRLMYEYDMSYLFGESLFVPFITISVAKIAANPTKRNLKLAMSVSIVKATLLLSGVPGKWLDNIFHFVQVIIDLGNDFALYLFSFIVCHIFLESFVTR